MSVLVSSQGAAFVTETGARSASAGGAFLTETVSVGAIVDLAGDLAFSIPFAGNVTDIHDFAGDLTVGVSFAADVVDLHDFAGGLVAAVTFVADLTVGAPANYVDFTGNLGGMSAYGKGKYGLKHYSRVDFFAPFFTADLDVHVSLIDLVGDMAPQIALGGDLTFDLPLEGNISLQIDLGASSLISEPLWGVTEPCPTPPWISSEPCPPSMWTPVPPPTFTPPSGGWTKQEEDDDVSVWDDAAQ